MTDTFDVHQAFMDVYNSTPLVDDPRTEADAELGRIVIEEYPAPMPHRDKTDNCVRLPIRLVHNAAMGIGLEIGPYDVDEIDIRLLKQAIAGYDRANVFEDLRRGHSK